MIELTWGARCFFWKMNWLTKKGKGRVLLTIIWDHRHYHCSHNPTRKPKGIATIYEVKGE